jgi:regulator of sirC expression with transglutaminase-like and TPR domain
MDNHLSEARRIVLKTLSIWASGLNGPEAKALAAAASPEELSSAYAKVIAFADEHYRRGRGWAYRRDAERSYFAAKKAVEWLDRAPSYRELDDWGSRVYRETCIARCS